MSRTHDIDNAEPLFEFDPYEQLKSFPSLEDASRGSYSFPTPSGSSHTSSSASTSHYRPHSPQSSMHQSISSDFKGKGVATSDPLPILPQTEYEDDPFFALSFQTPSSSSRPPRHFTPPHTDYITSEMVEMLFGEEPLIGKGKGRELPPSLPPLSFTPPSFLYGSPESIVLPGPSSYDSTTSSIVEVERSPVSPFSLNTDSPASPPNTPNRADGIPHIPVRARSLSSLSTRSRPSLSGLSISKVKSKLTISSKPHSTIARRLLFKKTQSPPNSPLGSSPFQLHDHSEPAFDTNFTQYGCVPQAGCLTPWVRDFRSRTPVATPVVETDLAWGAIHSAYRVPRPTDTNPLRTKGRSYSSPLPLQASVFDIVPLAPADIFAQAPTPIIIPDYFDDYLPRELKLHIFIALVFVHQSEYLKRLQDSKWTALKAASSRNKWVGRDKGIRELFKLSRVSKSWQSLVFDGQLWVKLELRSFPKLPSSVLCRLAELAGGFIREIDFTGHANLPPSTMLDIADHLCVKPTPSAELPHTRLTSINLQGCSALTTRSLHHLLIRSPALKSLYVKGLPAVTNTTCDVLAAYCPQLVTLDMSRCPNMSGDGVRSVASASVDRGEHMVLKVLKLSGLKRVTDDMMEALGKAAPYLEVLDISGARDLHNSSIDAFVACTEQDAAQIEAIGLTSREAGRDPNNPNRHWRRVTKLRHLSLSGCILLTDHACSHLAHSVPKLEFLELAGIGAEIRDDGLIRLLETTPFIRKIDLEDATEVSDDVLEALTPSLSIPSPPAIITGRPSEPPEPGHALEHLILSYTNISSDALSELIRCCTRLQTLEADNTRMTGLALRDFVQHARKREMENAKIVAIDCRAVGEHAVKDLTAHTRPRLGWRSWHARKLGFLDGRDEEGFSVGQDECDASRVVVKTFYSWQTVDAVRAARDKKRKSGSRRGMNGSNGSATSEDAIASSSGRARWWTPGGRRSGGPNTPTLLDINDREGCTIM